jgi:hypothetical protein
MDLGMGMDLGRAPSVIFLQQVEPERPSRRLRNRAVYQGRVMKADRAGLGFLGFVFGGVTAAVMVMAFTVVLGHVDGRFALDAPKTTISVQQ